MESMPANRAKISLCKFAICSFFLNLFWEIAHSPLYNWEILSLQNDIYFYVPTILKAAVGDAFYLLLAVIIVAAFTRSFSFLAQFRGWRVEVALLGASLAVACFIEIKAKILNSWSYADAMPTIFTLGLSPLLQLPLTMLAALWFSRKFK